MVEVKKVFKKKGSDIVVKRVIEDQVLRPMDVLNSLQNIKQQFQKADQAIAEAQVAIKQNEEAKEQLKQDEKELKVHEEFCKEVQESKVKTTYWAKREELFKQCLEDHKEDLTMGPEGHKRQFLGNFQNAFARTPDIGQEVSRVVWEPMIFTDPFFADEAFEFFTNNWPKK